MKINLSRTVTLGDGTALLMRPEGPPMTVGAACRAALNSITSDDPHMKRLSPEEIFKRGRLALLMAKEGAQELSPEDVAFIRQALKTGLTIPEVIVIVHDMLEEVEKDQADGTRDN
jgi:hypothetical protein